MVVHFYFFIFTFYIVESPKVKASGAWEAGSNSPLWGGRVLMRRPEAGPRTPPQELLARFTGAQWARRGREWSPKGPCRRERKAAALKGRKSRGVRGG